MWRRTFYLLAMLVTAMCSMAIAAESSPLGDGGPAAEIPDSSTREQLRSRLSDTLIASLQDMSKLGISLPTQTSIADQASRIADELAFAGRGGVLLIADVLVQTSDSTRFRLLDNDLHYVGIGATAADALLSELTRTAPPSVPGWHLDLDRSKALWIERDAPTSVYKVWILPKRTLLRQAMTTYSERTLANFDWQTARASELQRLIAEAERSALDADTRRRIREIDEDRRGALAERDRLNARLARALQRAEKAAMNAMIVRGLAEAADFGLSAAKKDMSKEDSDQLDTATNNQELVAMLLNLETKARDESLQIRTQAQRTATAIHGYEHQQIEILRTSGVPVANIPSGSAPIEMSHQKHP